MQEQIHEHEKATREHDIGRLQLKRVDVSPATGGDPKAWSYPRSASFNVNATFDYAGLPSETFRIKAPQSITVEGGGSLHLSLDLNGSGRTSGDSHFNLWINGLKFEGPNVLEAKVNANETKTLSHDYTLHLTDPRASEVSFTVGLTWGGPKYTFVYIR